MTQTQSDVLLRGEASGCWGFWRDGRTKRMMAVKKSGPVAQLPQTGPGGYSSRPHQAIPCWVAPLQSPTPFHQASFMIIASKAIQNRFLSEDDAPTRIDLKTSQTRSPALTEEQHTFNKYNNPKMVNLQLHP